MRIFTVANCCQKRGLDHEKQQAEWWLFLLFLWALCVHFVCTLFLFLCASVFHIFHYYIIAFNMIIIITYNNIY